MVLTSPDDLACRSVSFGLRGVSTRCPKKKGPLRPKLLIALRLAKQVQPQLQRLVQLRLDQMVGLEKKEKKRDQEEARRSEANPCPGKAY